MQKDGFQTLSHDFRNIFEKWRSEDINKDDNYIYIKFVQKTFSFRKHFGTVLTEEIRVAKFCTEVFKMPKLFCGVCCSVTLPFWHFCFCRGFCHRTGSDLLLFVFVFNDQTKYTWIILIHVSNPCNRFIPTILHNYSDMVNNCYFCTCT